MISFWESNAILLRPMTVNWVRRVLYDRFLWIGDSLRARTTPCLRNLLHLNHEAAKCEPNIALVYQSTRTSFGSSSSPYCII